MKITNFTKFMNAAKFTIIRQSIHEIYKIYSSGYKEVPDEICQSYEFYKFTKTSKFTIICLPIHEIYKIFSKGYKELPNKLAKITKFTNQFTKHFWYFWIDHLIRQSSILAEVHENRLNLRVLSIRLKQGNSRKTKALVSSP